jgi:hypothetical protein
MPFVRARKSESKLRLALAGPAGSGKTWTALTLATALAAGKGIAVIDTERGSASKYADLFAFDVLELESFHPDRYVEAISDAVAGGYAVVVVDSLSHAWNGRGGMLEQIDRIAKVRHSGNTFKAWGDAEAKRMEQGLTDALTGLAIHIIATMRTKTEYVVETNEKGKAAPRKVGTAPIQRDGLEYEFDIVGELTIDNDLIVQKTRCTALTGQVIHHPGRTLAETLRAWLEGEPLAAVEPKPAPRPAPAPTPIRQAPPERKPAASVPKEPLGPTPDQVRVIAGLCAELGRGLPDNLTFQTAGKMIFELKKELRESGEMLTRDPQPEPDLSKVEARLGA